MSDQTSMRDRYLRDPVATRLGGLAANLARIKSFSANPQHGSAVSQLIRESALFIEWTAPEAAQSHLRDLAELQRELVRWNLDWSRIWADGSERALVAQRSAEWSRRILEMSGLAPRAT
jgi:hypothetical protein